MYEWDRKKKRKPWLNKNCTKTLLRLLKTTVIHYLLSYCVVLSVNNFIINIIINILLSLLLFFLFIFTYYYIYYFYFIYPPYTPLSLLLFISLIIVLRARAVNSRRRIQYENHDTGKYTPALRPCKHIPLEFH